MREMVSQAGFEPLSETSLPSQRPIDAVTI